KLRVLAKDLKGGSGYKQCRHNEICALLKNMATLVLFLTLTPADIADPLLGAIGSVLPENFRKMDVFQYWFFVAKNPGPA
ncbi:hypothetical protein K438DRAFT_1473123, partial [Mycena galopus ATCC 62051]